MVETIFSTPLAQVALVFLLVFTVVFAVLQKTKVLGEGKKQVDALVALAVGLIVISVGYATELINNLIPVLAVGLIILLVFMLLVGSMYQEGAFKVPGWLLVVFGIIAFIVVLVAVLLFTGAWDYLYQMLVAGDKSAFVTNVVVIVVIIVAVIVVVAMGGGGKKGD